MSQFICNVFVVLPNGTRLHHTIDEYGDFAMKTRCGLPLNANGFDMVHPKSVELWGDSAFICRNCKRRKHREGV